METGDSDLIRTSPIFGTFFGISFSLTSLKFGKEQARGKPLLYVFE